MAECMRHTDLFCKECGTYRHCFASDERPDRLARRNSLVRSKAKFDRNEAHRNYMRDYMRKRRQAEKAK